MRTTLDIANDVLQAAKDRARREKKTTGEVISELARAVPEYYKASEFWPKESLERRAAIAARAKAK